MDDLTLRPYDGAAVVCFLTLPVLFYTGPAMLTEQSGQSAWIAVLSAHLLLLCVFLALTVLVRYTGGKDLILAARSLAGRPIGILYGALLAAYFCFSTGLLVRECAEILKAYGLSLTPVYMVSGLLLGSAVAMNLFGGKAIVKSAGFFLLIVLLGLAVILMLGANRYRIDYLFPILGNGVDGLKSSTVSAASMVEGVIILGLLTPAFKDTSKLRRSGIIALGISCIFSVIFYLCLIMMFSAPLTGQMTSGFMEMGKSIYYNRFFYRFESGLLFFLIFASSLKASIGLYIARKSAATAFGINAAKALTLVCAALVFGVAMLPTNLHDLTVRYLSLTRGYSAYFMAGAPLLLFLIAGFRRLIRHEK
ncbi:MAG: GerAB/ArcD/ProY family transporter [Oscillospiraceae bacterium]|nr:GerAB/ArcD/ProY family transporter [Oscillospiraceae bacterium]